MTHDYTRNGTTTLFAALDVLTGTVIGQCLPRHRHTEFIKFMRTIDREVPDGLQIHLILDNYSTHKHAEVDRWLKRHSRFHLHFTPPQGVRQRARSDRQHPGIPQRPQRRSQTLRMDSHRRIHPRQSPARTHQTPTSSQHN